MNNKFFIATKNAHKLLELKRMLLPMGIEVICETDLDFALSDVEENGSTFEENALLKAHAGMVATGLVSVADDSGLCVDALDGAPGIYSARFAGEPSDNDKNNKLLLCKMKNVPDEKRTAKFVSAIACVFPDGREFTVRGEVFGKIGYEPKGENGFGYDPLFISEIGCFGEVTDDEKDAISHRSRSLEKFMEQLKILDAIK